MHVFISEFIMSNPFFKFKKFTVFHNQCAMKVGTDGVLLGAWCDIQDGWSALDVGTGSGLIALMLAQRANATIDAIDIDLPACRQAAENCRNSIYNDRLQVHHTPFESYVQSCEKKYDLIVSNPPYFSRSLKCPDPQRSTARHDDRLPLSSMLAGCRQLITEKGKIALILPSDALGELKKNTGEKELYLSRLTHVMPVPGASPKRILAELVPLPVPLEENELAIEESRHVYTSQYIALTKDFYLKM